MVTISNFQFSQCHFNGITIFRLKVYSMYAGITNTSLIKVHEEATSLHKNQSNDATATEYISKNK